MQGKVEELITERGNFDTRKVNNLSRATIAEDVLRSIEAQGVTLEHLQALRVPVCRYKTQITLHGVFPELLGNDYSRGRIGGNGYKCMIRNGNGSLGVRYIAVDRAKKQAIYGALRFAEGWHVQDTSSEFFAYLTTKTVQSKAELLPELETLKAKAARVNTSLFFGRVQTAVFAHPYFGYYGALILDLGCIPAGNEAAIVENITGRTLVSIQQAQEEKRKADEMERAAEHAKYETERAEREERERIERAEICKLYGLTYHERLASSPGIYIVQGGFSGSWFVREVYKSKHFGRHQRTSRKFENLQAAAAFVKSGQRLTPQRGDKVMDGMMHGIYTI